MFAFRRFALIAAAALALSLPAAAETASADAAKAASAMTEDALESADAPKTATETKDEDDYGIAPARSHRRVPKTSASGTS
jgi:hypothetical protein